MEEFVARRPKMYSYFRDEGLAGKKDIKCTKKCVFKRKIKLQDYKECLEKNKTILKQQQRFGVSHAMYSLKKSATLP